MTRLGHKKLFALNVAVEEIYATAWMGRLVESLPDIAAKLMGTDMGLCDLITPTEVQHAISAPFAPNLAEIAIGFFPFGHQHPTRGLRPVAQGISDHLSRRAWHRTGLYSEFMKNLGVEDDLGLDVAIDDGGKICFCVQRKGWNFRQEERVVVDLLGPHVRSGWLQSERLKRGAFAGSWSESLERALGHGLIRLDESGRVLSSTAQTRAQLERFTGAPRTRSHLPSPVLEWFREQVRRRKEKRLAEQPPVVLTLERHPAVLDLQFVAEAASARYYLVTEERPLAAHPSLLQTLGLSAREQEVLFWLAQGKGNQIISQILGISVHTVKRHLEKIYAKLSLDGRLAASSFAQEYLHRATRPGKE